MELYFQVIIQMENNKGKEELIMLMAVGMKGNFNQMNIKVQENIIVHNKTNDMMDIGLIAKCMDLVLLNMKMVDNIQVILLRTNVMGQGNIIGLMGEHMKDLGKMENKTVMEYLSLQVAKLRMEFGKMVK